MVILSRRAVVCGVSLIPLAGCAVPPPEFVSLDYASRADGRFIIPAVPIDQVPAGLRRQVVPFETDRPVGSIVIVSGQRSLHWVLEDGYALRYGIAIGREGIGWTGEAEIYRRAHWPTWTPTPTMIARDPGLERWAEGQPGGPTNPLGARALYLYQGSRDTLYRIHGTPYPWTIGESFSSGCIRMMNDHAIDLYDRVPVGTRVVVS